MLSSKDTGVLQRIQDQFLILLGKSVLTTYKSNSRTSDASGLHRHLHSHVHIYTQIPNQKFKELLDKL